MHDAIAAVISLGGRCDPKFKSCNLTDGKELDGLLAGRMMAKKKQSLSIKILWEILQ